MPTWLPLGCGVNIAVSDAHRFGTDAVLLAHFAQPNDTDCVCDLCTGCGILPFLWLRDGCRAPIVGVELQKDAVALADETCMRYHFTSRVRFCREDLRSFAPSHVAQYSLVTCNPPYFPLFAGRSSAHKSARLARQEGYGCTFDEVCMAATQLLTVSGRFCFCHRPMEQERLFDSLSNNGLIPTRTVMVQQRVDTTPFLLLVEASKTAYILQHDEWVLEENGHPSPLYQRIYAPILTEVTP